MARPDVGVILVLATVGFHHGTPDRSRYVMEPDEILARAALCLPSRAIPVPCPRRVRPKR
jgi:hypothetical protein